MQGHYLAVTLSKTNNWKWHQLILAANVYEQQLVQEIKDFHICSLTNFKKI